MRAIIGNERQGQHVKLVRIEMVDLPWSYFAIVFLIVGCQLAE